MAVAGARATVATSRASAASPVRDARGTLPAWREATANRPPASTRTASPTSIRRRGGPSATPALSRRACTRRDLPALLSGR